jgi:hypothetical protein
VGAERPEKVLTRTSGIFDGDIPGEYRFVIKGLSSMLIFNTL